MAKSIQNKKVKKVAEKQTENKIDEKIDERAVGTKVTTKVVIASLPFVITAIVWILIWIIPKGPVVVDPWYQAVKLVDSSNKVSEANLKIKLREEGGDMLKDLIKKYPFHARVQFFLGYYYFVCQKWDSALVPLKEAARIDSGASINAVWPDAHDLIAKAALNKALVMINNQQFAQAKDVLLDAYPYYPNNPFLNKFLGSVYFNLKEDENALRYSLVSFNGNPKDSEVANLIGVLYKTKGDMMNATSYFKRALELNPNNVMAKNNLNSLSVTQ